MLTTPLRTIRYMKAWATERAAVTEELLTLERGGVSFRAAFVHPSRGDGPWPAWIVLHGITRRGVKHAQLARFTRALAATGAAVLVPEVPEWRELDLAPRLARPTILRAIEALATMDQVRAAPYAIVGFSFGAPHAIGALADPEIAPHLAGAVGFGGYRHLERSLRFMFTGAHEYGGVHYHNRPDPYGRWIVAANYLTHVEEHQDAGDVAEELRRLAALAGDTGAVAWDPVYDPAKVEARTRIDPSRLPLFDLIAPPSNEEPDPVAGAELAARLTEAAIRVDPDMDPGSALAGVRAPVHILHGHSDHLIPFTEGIRLAEALPDDIESYGTITRLFGHSAQDPFPSPAHMLREVPLFLRAIGRMLKVV